MAFARRTMRCSSSPSLTIFTRSAIRCAEEIAIRLHQATGIDPADSVKRFSEGRGIPLWLTGTAVRTVHLARPNPYGAGPTSQAVLALVLQLRRDFRRDVGTGCFDGRDQRVAQPPAAFPGCASASAIGRPC